MADGEAGAGLDGLSPAEIDRAERLFARTADVTAEEAEEALRCVEQTEPRIAHFVRALLARDRRSSRVELALLPAPRTSAALPERVGPYEIEGVLGHGSFCVVYAARRSGARRRIALKVYSEQVTDRARVLFERELAAHRRLDHPGVARVLAHGEAVLGADPALWIAMERVEGEGFLEHARGRDPAARLNLFLALCDVVRTAHERGVLHRDLKPANLLVDAAGRVRVLDFGLALLTCGTDGQEARAVGTPAYMSPEQAIDPARVDGRSEVFSLGVILFELFAGRLPWAALDLDAPSPHRRPESLGTVAPEAPRSLRCVCAVALRSDPARRYPDVGALEADLRRILAGRVPHAALLRLGLPRAAVVVWREILALIAVSLVVLLLFLFGPSAVAIAVSSAAVGVAAGATWITARARRTAARERRHRQEAERRETAFALFFEHLLESVAPLHASGEFTLHELLDTAGERLAAKPPGEPAVEGHIRQILGRTWRALGRGDRAADELESAVEILDHAGEPRGLDVLTAKGWLAIVLREAGELDVAETLQEEIVAAREEVLGRAHPDTLTAIGQLGILRKSQGRLQEADLLLEEAVEGLTRHAAEAPEHLPIAQLSRGLLLFDLDRREEGLGLVRKASSSLSAALGPEHAQSLAALNNLATLLARSGRHEEACARFRELLEVQERVLGPAHPWSLSLLFNLGATEHGCGRVDEARALLERAARGARETLHEDHPLCLSAEERLLEIELDVGDAVRAREGLEQLRARALRALPDGNPLHDRLRRALERAEA